MSRLAAKGTSMEHILLHTLAVCLMALVGSATLVVALFKSWG